jgi:hypothetical protein
MTPNDTRDAAAALDPSGLHVARIAFKSDRHPWPTATLAGMRLLAQPHDEADARPALPGEGLAWLPQGVRRIGQSLYFEHVAF